MAVTQIKKKGSILKAPVGYDYTGKGVLMIDPDLPDGDSNEMVWGDPKLFKGEKGDYGSAVSVSTSTPSEDITNALANNINTFRTIENGTYGNFGGIVVSEVEYNTEVYFFYINNEWIKHVKNILPVETISKIGNQILGNKHIYNDAFIGSTFGDLINGVGWKLAWRIPLDPSKDRIFINGWNTSRHELCFFNGAVPSDVAVIDSTHDYYSQLIYFGNVTKVNGSAVVLIPAGATWMAVTIKNASESDTVYSGLMVSYTDIPFEPFNEEIIISKIQNENIASQYIKDDNGVVLSVDDILCRRLEVSMNKTLSRDVVIKDSSIGLRYGMTVFSSDGRNGVINFYDFDFKGMYYVSNDDVAPVHIQGHTVGANHGWFIDQLTSNSHGLTSANIGQDLVDENGWKWTIVNIIDVNRFLVIGENTGPSIYMHNNRMWGSQISLTNGIITLAISGSVGVNLFPSIKMKYKKLLIDGKEVSADGSYNAAIVELIEEYDILNLESIRQNAANPMEAIPTLNIKNTYRFTKDGQCLVIAQYYFHHEVLFSDLMTTQFSPGMNNVQYYFPKSLPLSTGKDFRNVLDYPNGVGGVDQLFGSGYWEGNKEVDRFTCYDGAKAIGFICGVVRDRGTGKNYRSNTLNSFQIRGNTGKIYPHPVDYTGVTNNISGGNIYQPIFYRKWFNASPSVNANIIDLGDKLLLLIDQHQAGTISVKIPIELNGKVIEILTNDNMIVGDTIINGELTVSCLTGYGCLEAYVKK